MCPSLTSELCCSLQKRLEHGALAKVRVESNGLTSLHYETYLQPKNKVRFLQRGGARLLDLVILSGGSARMWPMPSAGLEADLLHAQLVLSAACMSLLLQLLTRGTSLQIGISGQLDAKDLNKAPKLGGFIDVQH